MLRQMERSTIQLLHKRGKSQRQIARELGYSRVTVARVLAEPVDRPPAGRRRRSILDPFRERITHWVREGLTAARMLELARADAEQPYSGGHSVFRVAVQQERLAQAQQQAVRDVSVRFEGLPAEYLQVDWGEVRRFPFTGQSPATRYFLACRLKYSRWAWVRWTSEMRQETLFRGLVGCCLALGWVPWVLVFDNMKTVTSGRDGQGQAIWHPALVHLAAEFGFHPEACTPGAGNQKGSVESLVKWVKGNFLAGRSFADDADLDDQCTQWLEGANRRPSQATDVAPLVRLVEEAAQGGPLPATAVDYGFAQATRVTSQALVPVRGNSYSVPLEQVGAPVMARVHSEQIILWRDTALLATHARAPDGAHRRVVEPAHFAPLFGRKPRAQVMLYRQALLDLGGVAQRYVSAVSQRQRTRLREEVLGVYALHQQVGTAALLGAMEQAERHGAYGTAYLQALLSSAPPAGLEAGRGGDRAAGLATLLAAAGPPGSGDPSPRASWGTADAPAQTEIDRALSSYEAYVRVSEGQA